MSSRKPNPKLDEKLVLYVCECGLKWPPEAQGKYCPAGHAYRFTEVEYVPLAAAEPRGEERQRLSDEDKSLLWGRLARGKSKLPDRARAEAIMIDKLAAFLSEPRGVGEEEREGPSLEGVLSIAMTGLQAQVERTGRIDEDASVAKLAEVLRQYVPELRGAVLPHEPDDGLHERGGQT